MTNESSDATPGTPRAMSWRDREHADQNDRSLIAFGSGFVTRPSGRVYVPLIGQPRAVPSQAAEELFVASNGTRWVTVGAYLTLMAILWFVGGMSLVAAWAVPSLVVFVALRYWLTRRQTRAWSAVSVDRTDLVVDAVKHLPSSSLVATLLGEALFCAFMGYVGVRTLMSAPYLASLDSIEWSALIVVVYVYTSYRTVLVLLRRRRPRTGSQITGAS